MKKIFGSLALFSVMNAEILVETQEVLETQEEILKEQKTSTKSGFFIGTQAGFSNTILLANVWTNDSMNPQLNKGHQISNFTLDAGIKIGYQYYFGKSQAFGFKTSMYAGIGTPLSPEIDMDIPAEPFYHKALYLPIKAGIDFNFLWDFFEDDDETIGLTAGFYYSFNHYSSLKNKNNVFLRPSNQVHYEPSLRNIDFPSLNIHEFSPQIGIHYYLGSHQFELNYQFGGLLGAKSKSKKIFWEEFLVIDTSLLNANYFSFNYTYRL